MLGSVASNSRVRALLVLLVLLAGRRATTSAPPAGTQLQSEMDLARLVDLCASRLELAIEYDAAMLKGKVTIRGAHSLSDSELWELTNRVLNLRGFATIAPAGQDGRRVMSVVRIGDAPALAAVQRESTVGSDDPGFVAVLRAIEHRPADEISQALGAVLSRSSGSASQIGKSNLILIADIRPRVDQALQILELLDVEEAASAVERIELHHTSAARLTAMLTSIVTARDLVEATTTRGRVVAEVGDRAVVLVAPPGELQQWQALIHQLDQAAPVETRTYSPRYFGIDEVARLIEQVVPSGAGAAGAQWRLVRDELTGSIILTATESQHREVEALVHRLDALPVESRRPVRSFRVRNRSVSEVVEVLERLMRVGVIDAAAGEADGGSASDPDQRALPDPESAPAGRPARDEDETRPRRQTNSGEQAVALTLTEDEATSTIIAMGEPRLLEQVAQLIAALDVRQPQVLVEILIVSLSDSQTLDLGVELEKIEIAGDVRITLSSLFGLSSLADGVRTVGNARGGSALVLSPGDFSVVLRALETVNEGRSLNVPRVLVNNNQEASLNSVLQQPFVSINAFDTIATTSFGGTQDAGTVVTVKPQIAEGDHLIVEYSVTLSSFVGESTDPSLPPPRQENRLQSVATVPDGYVVVLGGIEVTNQSSGRSQVPGLGGIPIFGELFRNRSKLASRNRFYIFIRPSVLRRLDFEDLRYVSEGATSDAGIDDGWPTVEPRLIR